jgi:hypothetical protein
VPEAGAAMTPIRVAQTQTMIVDYFSSFPAATVSKSVDNFQLQTTMGFTNFSLVAGVWGRKGQDGKFSLRQSVQERECHVVLV